MAYINELFPVSVSYGAQKIIKTNNNTAQNLGGYVQTNVNWSKPLDEWSVGFGIRSKAEALEVTRLYQVAFGAYANSFRFKDWFDYEVQDGSLVSLGGGTYQLYRDIDFGGQSLTRKVTKPVTGTITVNSGTITNVNLETGVITVTGTPTSWSGQIYKHVHFVNEDIQTEIVDSDIFNTTDIRVREVRE